MPIHPEWHPDNLNDQVSVNDQVNQSQRTDYEVDTASSDQVNDQVNQGQRIGYEVDTASSDQVSDQDNDQVSDQDNDQVSDQVINVLKSCSVPKSRGEILKSLGLKNHFDNYERYIEPAIENNWISMTIPDKPRSRNQKYLITAKGQAFLDQLSKKKKRR